MVLVWWSTESSFDLEVLSSIPSHLFHEKPFLECIRRQRTQIEIKVKKLSSAALTGLNKYCPGGNAHSGLI